MYQSRDAQEPYSSRNEDARAGNLGFAKVLCQSYGCDRFHGLHGQRCAEGEACKYVGQSAEDERAGKRDGAGLSEGDEDGEEGADVAKRAGYLGQGMAVECFYVVSLNV